jgi:hypothetical protein
MKDVAKLGNNTNITAFLIASLRRNIFFDKTLTFLLRVHVGYEALMNTFSRSVLVGLTSDLGKIAASC